MIGFAILSAYVASLQAIAAIHIENPIVTVLLGILYFVALFFAIDREADLMFRVEELEEKLKKYESEGEE